MRDIRWVLGLATVAIVLTACSPAAAASGPPPSAPPGGAVIVAEGVAFDRTQLAIPTGVAAPLLFENRDFVPHNVTILDPGGSVVFAGEMVGGPGSRTYVLPALVPGRYGFRCDVHPYMTGTVDVGS
jgi:plastocyanin